MSAKNLIILIVVILSVVAVIFYLRTFKKSSLSTQNLASTQTETSLPEATGNIDDAVNAFLKEAAEDEMQAKKEDADKNLVTNDSKEVGSFDQSINETDF